jgi:hypothetical protein
MAYTLIGGTAAGTVLILLFLPALYAAWFRIKPAADDVHQPAESTEELEVQQQRLPNLALLFGGAGSTSRPLSLPEHTEGQLREFTAYR